MAMNWAFHGVDISAVDLNPVAVEQTKKRFALYGLSGDIHGEDSNKLSFKDGKFDYSYSWGVLHHSPHLEKSIAELMRVTKKGGGFGIMLYNRHSLLHWYMTEYIEGFLHYEKKFLNFLELASRYCDGRRQEGNPCTWPVTRHEIMRILQPFSSDVKVKIFGTDLEYVFSYLLPGIGKILPVWIKKVWARRFGWSIWAYGHKRIEIS